SDLLEKIKTRTRVVGIAYKFDPHKVSKVPGFSHYSKLAQELKIASKSLGADTYIRPK
ncbi:hypothetical protein HYY71_00250, partial [Candidatus Woesearchaeota archaeon]|nr:hypothetical protein [Candidatus Woesearchaeota archaeon]